MLAITELPYQISHQNSLDGQPLTQVTGTFPVVPACIVGIIFTPVSHLSKNATVLSLVPL
jgi:hypothetical protein